MASGPNESAIGPYDYLYDNSDNVNSNGSTSGLFGGSGNEPQHLAFMLAQLFSKISDNPNNSKTSTSAGSLSSNETHSYRLLALLSLWFVLILNPIVVRQQQSRLSQPFRFSVRRFCSASPETF